MVVQSFTLSFKGTVQLFSSGLYNCSYAEQPFLCLVLEYPNFTGLDVLVWPGSDFWVLGSVLVLFKTHSSNKFAMECYQVQIIWHCLVLAFVSRPVGQDSLFGQLSAFEISHFLSVLLQK